MDTNVQGTVRVLECARHAGVEKFVYAASSSCYGLAAVPTREDHPIDAAISLRAVQVPGRAGGVPLAPRLRAAGELDLHLQRLRPARAHDRRLRRGVRRVLPPEARRQAVHGRRRRHPAPRFHLRDRRRPGVPGGRPQRRSAASVSTSAPATRSRSTGWSSCSAATWSTSRSVRASPTAPGPTSRRSSRGSGWQPKVSFEDGVRRMLVDIECWRDAPLWDPDLHRGGDQDLVPLSRRSRARKRSIDAGRPARAISATRSRRRGAARHHRAAPARRSASSCATACSTSCIPATSATCSTPRARPTCWSPASPPTSTSPRALSAARAAGPARGQSGRVRDGRLRRHRPERQRRSRTSALIQPDYFAKGYEYTASGMPPKTAEEVEVVQSYGGEIIFTPGDIVYSSSSLIDLAPPTIKLEKLQIADGAQRHHLRQAARRRSTPWSASRVHVVGDTIVDSYTYCAMIGGQTKTPTMSVLFERKVDYVGGAAIVAKHLRAAGGRGDLLDRARRRRATRTSCSTISSRPASTCRAVDRPDAADDQQERDRRRRLPAAEGRHARQPLDLRPDPGRHHRRRCSRCRPTPWCSAISATASSTGAPSRSWSQAMPRRLLPRGRQPGREPLGQHHRIPGLRSDHAERARGALRARRPGFRHPSARLQAVRRGALQAADPQARRARRAHLPQRQPRVARQLLRHRQLRRPAGRCGRRRRRAARLCDAGHARRPQRRDRHHPRHHGGGAANAKCDGNVPVTPDDCASKIDAVERQAGARFERLGRCESSSSASASRVTSAAASPAPTSSPRSIRSTGGATTGRSTTCRSTTTTRRWPACPTSRRSSCSAICSSNGKHVLVEKPLWASATTTSPRSRRWRARKGVVCYTAYNHRFEPHFVRMRDLIASGELGTHLSLPHVLRQRHGAAGARFGLARPGRRRAARPRLASARHLPLLVRRHRRRVRRRRRALLREPRARSRRDRSRARAAAPRAGDDAC